MPTETYADEQARVPRLSVIAITPDRYERILSLLRHLKDQSVQKELEVVIVAPSAKVIPLDAAELQGFHSVKVIPFGSILSSTAAARVAGVRAARAPIVAFVEDHSFPQPGWAAALMAAHNGNWAAVGPSVGNANPQYAISWANLLIEYAPWLDPEMQQAAEHLPGHNSSYKRAILLEYGDRLESMLQAESILHWDLRAKGLQLCLEPAAKTLHMNYSTFLASVRLRFHGGRTFAAARARNWPILKRFAYGAAVPLIPMIRLRRILSHLGKRNRPTAPIKVFPVLLMLLCCDAAGELTGYLVGIGNEAARAGKYEFFPDRERSVQSCTIC